MATFVLVHGAWGGGWVWTDAARRLRAAGHEVFAPTLTGLGERSHLLTRDVDLETHVADVLGVLRWERLENVTLVGHSYAGMVISGVADRAPERIGSIVYFDAFVPEASTAMLDLMPAERAEGMRRHVAEEGDGWMFPPPDLDSYFSVDDPAERAWLQDISTPHPFATMTQRLELAGRHLEVATKGYLLAGKRDPTPFRRFAEALGKDPAWRVLELPTHHFAMVSMPAETVAFLTAQAA